MCGRDLGIWPALSSDAGDEKFCVNDSKYLKLTNRAGPSACLGKEICKKCILGWMSMSITKQQTEIGASRLASFHVSQGWSAPAIYT
jgi:hypothetical protein